MRALKTFGVTLWKEWRDHKVMLIAIAITLPVLTAIAFWAFGEHLVGSTVRTQLLIFLPVALGLVFFSIAADLVSGEKRNQTLDLLRRLPGGMTRTFVVKWFFLLGVSLAAMLYQGFLLAWAWEWMADYNVDGGYGGFNISTEIQGQIAAFPSSWFWQLALVGMVLPPWAFVVSTWLGRSGAAAIASLLVLGGLLAPWGLMLVQYPWFFPFGPEHVPAIAGIVIGMAVLVSAVSYIGGLRYHGAVWKPGLLGLACVLVLAGAGYGYAHVELHRWQHFDQHDPALRIKGAYVADGGTRLYLNVHKGHPWFAGEPDPSHGGDGSWLKSGMPVQTWIVDLETGGVTRDSADGEHLFLPVNVGSSSRWGLLAPHRIIQRWHYGANESYEIRWLDAETGDVIDTLDPRTRSPAVDRAIREDARRYGAHTDSAGRRSWIRDGAVERDGALLPIEDRVRVPTRNQMGWSFWNPVGWTQYRFEEDEPGSNQRSVHWYFLDAESGEEIEVTRNRQSGGQHNPGTVLDREWSLLSFAKTGYFVERLLDGADRRAAENVPLQFIGVVGARSVLGTYALDDGRRELRLWDPVTGATRPIELVGGPLPLEINVSMRGRSEDGRIVLSSLVAGETWSHILLVVDPKARTARRIASGEGWSWSAFTPLTLDDDGSVIGIEEGRRIVRVGPAMNQREVLFPR